MESGSENGTFISLFFKLYTPHPPPRCKSAFSAFGELCCCGLLSWCKRWEVLRCLHRKFWLYAPADAKSLHRVGFFFLINPVYKYWLPPPRDAAPTVGGGVVEQE